MAQFAPEWVAQFSPEFPLKKEFIELKMDKYEELIKLAGENKK